MDVVLLSPDREKAWKNFVKDSSLATSAHLLGWRNVVEKTYHHTPYYFMAMDGGTVVGCLPLFLIKSRLFGRFLTTAPYLSYGGLLAEDEEAARALVEAAKELAYEQKARYVEIRGLNKVGHGLQLKEKYCMYLLSLAPDPEAVWRGLEKRARSAVRRAINSGVTVEWGAHLMSDFVEILCRLMRDLGTPFHGEPLYRNILDEFSGQAEIFMARYQGRLIGAGLTVTTGKTLAWPYGGCLKIYRDLAAMSLLTWEIIRYGCQRGSTSLDLGRSQWNSGTALFKRQWGARPFPLFYEYHMTDGVTMPDMDPTNPRFRFALAVWKRLPVFAARALGPLIISDIP